MSGCAGQVVCYGRGTMRRRSLALLVSLLALAPGLTACKGPDAGPPSGSDSTGGAGSAKRAPLVPKDHAYHARLEGAGAENACSGDAECFKAGCSGEICAATKDVVSTCEVLPVQIPASASCGCVSGECIWWTSDGSTLQAAPIEDPPANKPGVACGDATCAPDEECIEYYGIAGPRGPKFQTCGIPCRSGKCPDGRKCVTIADGPGPVCQTIAAGPSEPPSK